MIEKKYIADVALIQDCRMSAYLHFRDVSDKDNELTIKMPDQEENPDVAELREKMEELLKEVGTLKAKKEETEARTAEAKAEDDQKKLAAIGEGEIPREEEESLEDALPEAPEEENKPKKRGRPKVE